MKYFVTSIVFSVLGASVSIANTKAQQCVVDMCGPAEKYAVHGESGRNMPVSKEVTKYIDEKLKPAVHAVLDIETKNFTNQTDFFTKYQYGNSKITLTREQKAVLLALYIDTKIPRLNNAATIDNGKYVIKAETLEVLTPGMLEAERELIRKFTELKLNSSTYYLSKDTYGLTMDTLMKVIWGADPQSQPEEVAAIIGNLHKAAVFLNQTLGESLFSSRNVKVLAAMAKARNYTSYQKIYFMEVAMKVFELIAYTDPETGILDVVAQYPLDIKSAAVELSDVFMVGDLARALSVPEYVESSKASAFDYCSTVVKGSLGAAPSVLRARQAIALQGKLKGAAQRAAVRYFSGAALKVAQDAIAGTRIMPVDNIEDFNKRVKTLVERKRLNAVELSRQISKAEKSELQRGSLLISSLRAFSKAQPGVFEAMKDSCRKLLMEDYSDRAFAIHGIVETSWQTGTFFGAGAGVTAHEIGHVVDFAIRNSQITGVEVAKFEEVKACNISAQKPILAMLKRAESDAVNYSAEDWADTFANSTMTELKKEWPYTDNFACSYMGAYWPYMATEDISAFGGENHSPAILRALKIQVNRGESIPESCKILLPANAIGEVLRTCEQ